jgi:hypothetical protein
MFKENINFLYILLIMIISLNVSAACASVVTLSWDAPNTNADGTPLTDLSGYKIYYGTSSHNYSTAIDVGNVTEYMVGNLENVVVYYFAVTAYDTSGNESEYSNEVKNITKCRLTIKKEGGGVGIITSYPEGINCGYDCKGIYKEGSVVILMVNPELGSNFGGWSEDMCTGYGYCILTLNENITLTANFTSSTDPLYVISPNGGEIIPAGSIYTILWEAPSETVSFDILYSLNRGKNWIPLAINITGTSYNWEVPATKVSEEEKGCLIKVTGYSASGIPLVEDVSDEYFSIVN